MIHTEMVAKLSTVLRMMTVQLTSSVIDCPTLASVSANQTCVVNQLSALLKIMLTDVPALQDTNQTLLQK